MTEAGENQGGRHDPEGSGEVPKEQAPVKIKLSKLTFLQVQNLIEKQKEEARDKGKEPREEGARDPLLQRRAKLIEDWMAQKKSEFEDIKEKAHDLEDMRGQGYFKNEERAKEAFGLSEKFASKLTDEDLEKDPNSPYAGIREYLFRAYLKGVKEAVERETGATRKEPKKTEETPSINPVVEEAEKEVFGTREAFSSRWVLKHNIPERVRYRYARHFEEEEEEEAREKEEFSTAEVFSALLETGGEDPLARRRLPYLIDACKGDAKERARLTTAIVNGFLPLARLKDPLGSGRIDTLAKGLQQGPTPEGIAQWLIFDDETRRAFALISRLQGYQIADEVDKDGKPVHDEIRGLDKDGKLASVDCKFSDFFHIRSDQIKIYLDAVREAVGTDPGTVRLAYMIFRVLGHPHENAKFGGELIGKYVYGFNGESSKHKDLDMKEVDSFLNKFKDPKNDRPLSEILEEEGVIGFATSLSRLPAEKIVREWSDYQLFLDMMDQISDIRAGLGAGSSLNPSERLKAIRSVKELGTLLAKRRLSQETVDRLMDTSKIALTPGSTEVSFLEKTLHGIRVPLGMGRKKPPVK